MTDIKVQIKLRSSVQLENDIIELLQSSGKRTGLPKQLLIAGYNALYGSEKKQITIKEKDNDVSQKPHAFEAFAIKG